jgi:hypothetical protein
VATWSGESAGVGGEGGGGGGRRGGNNRTRPKGVDDKNLNVPAQENSTALDKMRLALANRPRRAKEEVEFANVRIIII